MRRQFPAGALLLALITPEGEMTTIEGSAEIADLRQWSARQLAAKK